jgi:cation transport ATPase
MLLAALGVVGPLAATVLDNGSSVAAAVNGLRPLA